MTIDVGYAHLALPDGTELDFVDVPGHDRLVGNMLVGAGEIDAALLVVAADDGPRAQTLEHLALLDALGIRHGVAVVTKTDLAGPERTAEVVAAVERLLAGRRSSAVAGPRRVGDRRDRHRRAPGGAGGAARPDRSPIDGRSAAGARLTPRDRPGLRGQGSWHRRDRDACAADRRARSGAPARAGRPVRPRPRGPGPRHDGRARADPGRIALNLAGADGADLHRGLVLTDDPAVVASDRILVRLAAPLAGPRARAGPPRDRGGRRRRRPERPRRHRPGRRRGGGDPPAGGPDRGRARRPAGPAPGAGADRIVGGAGHRCHAGPGRLAAPSDGRTGRAPGGRGRIGGWRWRRARRGSTSTASSTARTDGPASSALPTCVETAESADPPSRSATTASPSTDVRAIAARSLRREATIDRTAVTCRWRRELIDGLVRGRPAGARRRRAPIARRAPGAVRADPHLAAAMDRLEAALGGHRAAAAWPLPPGPPAARPTASASSSGAAGSSSSNPTSPTPRRRTVS